MKFRRVDKLRYGLCSVCLSECLACVIESQFPLAAVLTLASAVQIHACCGCFRGNGSVARAGVLFVVMTFGEAECLMMS